MKTYGGVQTERNAFLLYNVNGSGQPETLAIGRPPNAQEDGRLQSHLEVEAMTKITGPSTNRTPPTVRYRDGNIQSKR
jgi:hypothetical protein